ncbi:tyrosine-type recombinase/integrase [Nocardioides massiliensis]|uniref:Integrase n=1 Tax=Nocardioides massiliensis TaxID=1325935 RepID=A0ABT9NJC7_9ACTN|nr:tyrosine-type recombinase/integrase [Nocardioides massiliensis]MDP9820456.1 integrase [Nocardioides massiliensis]
MHQALSDAIDDYQRWRKSQQISKQTIANEASILRRFLSVNGNIQCRQISEVHVTRHMEDASKTRSTDSLKLDHTVLTTFFKWMRHTKRLPTDRDPMFGRRTPKTIRKERNRLHVSAFPLLLDTAEKKTPRNRALVALMLYTLLRDQDIADLRIRDLDMNAGYLMCRIKKTKLEDRMPVSLELDTEMRQWLTAYTKAVGVLQPHYYLIPRLAPTPMRGADGMFTEVLLTPQPELPLSRGTRVIQGILQGAGFPITDSHGNTAREGCHTLRRSGARALFDQLVADGYDGALRVVQAMLHHSSVEQTERYIGITADRRTRDDLLKGKQMYRLGSGDGVVSLVR